MSQALQTPFAISVGLGLAASSYFIYGNVGMVTCGVIKMTTSATLRADLDINPDRAVSLWACMFENGAAQFVPTSLLSPLALFAASHYAKEDAIAHVAAPAHRTLVSSLFLTAACFASATLPFTRIVMFPNIHTLIETRNRIRAARKNSGSSHSDSSFKPGETITVLHGAEAEDSLRRIVVWKWHNYVRMSLGAVAWAFALAGVILA